MLFLGCLLIPEFSGSQCILPKQNFHLPWVPCILHHAGLLLLPLPRHQVDLYVWVRGVGQITTWINQFRFRFGSVRFGQEKQRLVHFSSVWFGSVRSRGWNIYVRLGVNVVKSSSVQFSQEQQRLVHFSLGWFCSVRSRGWIILVRFSPVRSSRGWFISVWVGSIRLGVVVVESFQFGQIGSSSGWII